MNNYDTQVFDTIMKRSIHVRECPLCGHVAEIRPIYGRTGARVQCPSCNYQTSYMGISECMNRNTDHSRSNDVWNNGSGKDLE